MLRCRVLHFVSVCMSSVCGRWVGFGWLCSVYEATDTLGSVALKCWRGGRCTAGADGTRLALLLHAPPPLPSFTCRQGSGPGGGGRTQPTRAVMRKPLTHPPSWGTQCALCRIFTRITKALYGTAMVCAVV